MLLGGYWADLVSQGETWGQGLHRGVVRESSLTASHCLHSLCREFLSHM